MNRIVINGNLIETSGRSISINNGTVIIDGKIIQNGITGNIDESGKLTVLRYVIGVKTTTYS